jgi:hypothetical protein
MAPVGPQPHTTTSVVSISMLDDMMCRVSGEKSGYEKRVKLLFGLLVGTPVGYFMLLLYERGVPRVGCGWVVQKILR